MTEISTVTDAELHAYVDGKLSPEKETQIEAWLAEHPEDASAVHAYRLQNSRLSEAFDYVLDEDVPSSLEAIVTQDASSAISRSFPWMRIAASVLMILTGAVVGWQLHSWQVVSVQSANNVFVKQALGAHRIFVAEVRHPVEVPSSQEAHLVKWLSKRLGRTIPTPNINEMGFELVGGRLLADGARPAAQFMYENSGGRRLTVYVRSTDNSEDTSFQFVSNEGMSAFYWIDKEFAYALVAPIEKANLLSIAIKVYEDLEYKPRLK
jgi:anti-sigma factor RsiW